MKRTSDENGHDTGPICDCGLVQESDIHTMCECPMFLNVRRKNLGQPVGRSVGPESKVLLMDLSERGAEIV